MANKRIIELQERTSIDMGDWLIVDSSTSTRKLSLATLFNYMTYSSMIFVTELPTTDISTTTIYLVPHSGSTTDWDEYIYRENEWVLIGTSTIDLSAIYQTKTDNGLNTTSKQIVGAINEVKSDLTKQFETLKQVSGNGTVQTVTESLGNNTEFLIALNYSSNVVNSHHVSFIPGLQYNYFELYSGNTLMGRVNINPSNNLLTIETTSALDSSSWVVTVYAR